MSTRTKDPFDKTDALHSLHQRQVAWAADGEGTVKRTVYQDLKDSCWHLLVRTETRVANIKLNATSKTAATKEAKTYA